MDIYTKPAEEKQIRSIWTWCCNHLRAQCNTENQVFDGEIREQCTSALPLSLGSLCEKRPCSQQLGFLSAKQQFTPPLLPCSCKQSHLINFWQACRSTKLQHCTRYLGAPPPFLMNQNMFSGRFAPHRTVRTNSQSHWWCYRVSRRAFRGTESQRESPNTWSSCKNTKTYMCCTVNIWSKIAFLLVEIWSKIAFLLVIIWSKFCFWFHILFSTEKMAIFQKINQQGPKLTILIGQSLDNCVAQHTCARYWPMPGPDIDFNVGQCLVMFCCFDFCWNHYLYSVCNTTNLHFKPPKNWEHDLWTQLRWLIFLLFFLGGGGGGGGLPCPFFRPVC